MDEDRIIKIYLVTEAKAINVNYLSEWTVEDLCIKVCKQIGIGPVARHLFALRNKLKATYIWYPANYKVKFFDKIKSIDKMKLEFRLRFKPSSLQRLKQLDIKAYDYYFHQARSDVWGNEVPDIAYDTHKRELFGLGVSDMYRVMLEQNLPQELVESDYKKYIPKECIKKHQFFIKKPIHNALARISGHDVSYVKEQYLNQFESMAPNYLCEKYKALMDKKNPDLPVQVELKINSIEIKYSESYAPSLWESLCLIEDLCFISIRQDNTVEVSRKNGIPSYLKFSTNIVLMSFVSAIDGYYRLSIKWTFNLCRDVITPSLEKLHKLKCHGPVSGEFSYGKLEEKRSNRSGTYLIRESESRYNVYYLDVCGQDCKPRTYRIEKLNDDEYVLVNTNHTYKSLSHLIALHQDPKGQLFLSECLPPSEYDKSSLLICATEGVGNDVTADDDIISKLLEGGPRCIPPQQLQIYKAQSLSKNPDIAIVKKSTVLYRAMWRVIKGKKLEAAIKILKDEDWRYTREFLELAGKWGQLRSGALVRLYGLTVAPTVGMLMELVKYGPLDNYLRNNYLTVKTVDMVQAAACLATAFWHLEENGVVHGNIRCKKLLVHIHTDNSFIVKLTDPGLFIYKQDDIHWLPPECYANPELARKNPNADIWAVATTLWQIFSKGVSLQVNRDIELLKKFYASGKRLSIPNGCPIEVYKLMNECWGDPGGPRKQPQAIMRDINQILYQVYNSRRTHTYATAFPKLFNDDKNVNVSDTIEELDHNSSSDGESRTSSLFTDRTSLPWDDTDDSGTRLIRFSETDNDAEAELSAYLGLLAKSESDEDSFNSLNHSKKKVRCKGKNRQKNIDENEKKNDEEEEEKKFVDRIVNNFKKGLDNNCSSLGQMQGIFELDADCNVILQGKIGQGFYGEVFRGTLERDNAKDLEPQQVAVKKLKTRALEADLQDFEREITIMKKLRHPNVVEILGVISEPEVCLVMEFVKHGSLQSYLAIHRENLTHKRLLNFSLDIATGMDYLGQKNIVHRDLAARNILVADDSKVKISDFGLAQVIGKNDYYILKTNRDLPIKWYAPESLRDGKFSPKSDVWSFGVTMYETFAFGEDPILPEVENDRNDEREEEGGSTLLMALERGTRLPCPSNCPQIIYVKLMYPCWHLQSHQRPDFAMLCDDIRDLISQY